MPLGNLGTNIRVTAVAAVSSFPFDQGLWESAGAGWCTANGGNITQEIGATSKNTIGTAGANKIYAIGSVTYFGQQSFVIVLDAAPSGWNQISVTPDGGASTIYTLSDSDLHVNPSFSDTYTLVWERGHLDFTNGISGVCVFNDGVQPGNYTWNAATGNPNPSFWQAAACDDTGQTIAAYSDGTHIHLYKSTNGGSSFSHLFDIADTGSAEGMSYNGRGTWFITSGSNKVWVGDGNTTWASGGALSSYVGATAAVNGTNVFCDGTGTPTESYTSSFVSGAALPTTTGVTFSGIAYDAAQAKFFACGSQTGGATGHMFLGLPTTSWVNKGAMNIASGLQMWASAWNNGTFGQSACIHGNSSTVFMVAQLTNNFCLQIQKGQTVGAGDPLGSGSLVNDGAGNWFYFDDAGVGATSADGIYWAGQSPSFAAGDYGTIAVYDSVHAAFIVFGGNGGGIFTTVSAPSGIVITPNPVTMNLGDGVAFSETGDDGSGVIWSVNGIVGGNATVGTINSVGNYLSPTQAQFIANGGPLTVTIGCANADAGPSPGTAAVTFNLPLITAQGRFRGQNAFKPVSLANVGAIEPKIYAPAENITVKRRP